LKVCVPTKVREGTVEFELAKYELEELLKGRKGKL